MLYGAKDHTHVCPQPLETTRHGAAVARGEGERGKITQVNEPGVCLFRAHSLDQPVGKAENGYYANSVVSAAGHTGHTKGVSLVRLDGWFFAVATECENNPNGLKVRRRSSHCIFEYYFRFFFIRLNLL